MTSKDGYIGAVKDKAEAIKGVSPLSSNDFTHITSQRYYSSCKSFKGTSEGPLTPGGGVGKNDVQRVGKRTKKTYERPKADGGLGGGLELLGGQRERAEGKGRKQRERTGAGSTLSSKRRERRRKRERERSVFARARARPRREKRSHDDEDDDVDEEGEPPPQDVDSHECTNTSRDLKPLRLLLLLLHPLPPPLPAAATSRSDVLSFATANRLRTPVRRSCFSLSFSFALSFSLLLYPSFSRPGPARSRAARCGGHA
ncbi:hypothetical protein ALC60_10587 [Trachymyrmex zeteki]|uniref:Uncharacterized protein n=1 Tax=Mycetomoellerius zeteki TaxID=64791 RepID=A0A151WQZ3_9HYME|nr:hypothetical protein ALC60_10587 [Trachymyrmex zeteki]